MHIAIVGLGPAGALLAHRAVQRNWTVDAYDPRCEIVSGDDGREDILLPRWRNTYGLFLDDLPEWAREVLIPAHRHDSWYGDLAVYSPRRRILEDRPYVMVDRDGTRAVLCSDDPRLRLHRRRISELTPEALGVDVVVDCRGVPGRQGDIRQLAYGVVVDGAAVRADGVFMDWRPVPDHPDGPASFLYVQQVEGGLLLEETVLATRAASRDTLHHLKGRLYTRCAGQLGDEGVVRETEIVSFPTDRRQRGWYTGVRDGVAVFGAAGGLTHPATGYSVAASAASVDEMLDLVAHGQLPRLRRLSAAGAYWLRLFGAELVVAAEATTLRRFFDAFFSLPAGLQRGYLSGQRVGAVAAAMLALAAFPHRTLPFLRPAPLILVGMVRRAAGRGSRG